MRTTLSDTLSPLEDECIIHYVRNLQRRRVVVVSPTPHIALKCRRWLLGWEICTPPRRADCCINEKNCWGWNQVVSRRRGSEEKKVGVVLLLQQVGRSKKNLLWARWGALGPCVAASLCPCAGSLSAASPVRWSIWRSTKISVQK
jgi:hypothetical protein